MTMDVQQLVEGIRDVVTVRRVFGDPYTQNGLTVVPAAKVQGGGGGGEGREDAGSSGEGGGFGVSARPAGVFVLAGEQVRWLPAIDANRMIAGFQVVAVVALLTARTIVKARLRASRRRRRR